MFNPNLLLLILDIRKISYNFSCLRAKCDVLYYTKIHFVNLSTT
ncbi:hypothetical protein GPUN_2658 [Glaciecola punicea ACAM 611]|uniref:Uncharacterized protein n=1 Tax=Glaciecola punicea ACAM 611 TaxID=1121923 RepID=H5TEP5_9ALTE|nr:hypothetical protein GPUN_2658 [Glaciecola punicea ACAM 611]